MSVYFYVIIAVSVFSLLAIDSNNTVNATNIAKNNKYKNVWLFCAAAVLICVSGLRYYVGTDYGAYYKIFDTSAFYIQSSILELDEPVFPIISEIIKLFTNDGAYFIFLTAAFTLAAISYITYKYTDTYLFSSLLIILTGVWHGSFNGVRQYFAAAIICLGYRFIFEKKFWKYLLYVFVAFLVHKSAIIMIVPYFILRNKISLKNIFLLTIGAFILLYNYETIFSLIGALDDKTFDANNSYTYGQVNIFRIIVNIVPAIFTFYLHNESEKDDETTFNMNILLLYALLSVVGMNSPYLSRVNIYLSVLLPLSMGKLIVFKDKKTDFIIKAIILILYFLFSFYEISISENLNTFRWIWER